MSARPRAQTGETDLLRFTDRFALAGYLAEAGVLGLTLCDCPSAGKEVTIDGDRTCGAILAELPPRQTDLPAVLLALGSGQTLCAGPMKIWRSLEATSPVWYLRLAAHSTPK